MHQAEAQPEDDEDQPPGYPMDPALQALEMLKDLYTQPERK
jgi:hypothetical protein